MTPSSTQGTETLAGASGSISGRRENSDGAREEPDSIRPTSTNPAVDNSRLQAPPGERVLYLEDPNSFEWRSKSKSIRLNFFGLKVSVASTKSSCARADPSNRNVQWNLQYSVPIAKGVPILPMISVGSTAIRKSVVNSKYVLTEKQRIEIRARRPDDGYTDVNGGAGTPFVVLGLFNHGGTIPRERLVKVTNPKRLFWQMWFHILRLRGIGYIFSLKDVKQFKLYRCNWNNGSHSLVESTAQDEMTLAALLWAYQSWSSDRADWTLWIHESLNYGALHPQECPVEHGFSLQVVLGWSPLRITLVILGPVILSLVLGLWFQSRDWTDLATIQTAWGIASYVLTAGGLIAALLGILSTIGGH